MKFPRLPRAALGLVLTWLGISLALGWRQRQQVLDEFSASAMGFVAGLQADIGETQTVGQQDALLLARSPSAHAVAAGNTEAIPELEALFVAYARSRSDVFQVRYLDRDGLERARIEHTPAGAAPVRDLQDKSDRYYFREATAVADGDVYVSPVDLNIERGAIERPLRPTVRFASPIRRQSELAGVIIINLEAKVVLERVARRRGQLPGRLMLVNADGVYASHPKVARQWGGTNMLATGEGLPRDDPELARWLWLEDSGATRIEDGVIATRAVHGGDLAPRVLLVTPVAEALQFRGGAFMPLLAGVALSGGLLGIVLVVLWRQTRLRHELAQEAYLRREIAERERRLKAAQEHLVASARLAALSQSAATLAHELRNPLGAIINSAGLLRSDRGMEADNRKLMEIIVAEGQRLDRAVSKFLGLVRRPRSRPAAVDLAKLVRDVVALARHDRAFDGANIRLESALRSGVPHVHADPDELQQVVWNLLRNAAQATERAGGSSVTITVRCEAETVVLELADEGPGPPEPHKDGEPPPHGTGLGLIVVAGVVAQNGGRFELVPRIDRQGAVARVILPIPAVREES